MKMKECFVRVYDVIQSNGKGAKYMGTFRTSDEAVAYVDRIAEQVVEGSHIEVKERKVMVYLPEDIYARYEKLNDGVAGVITVKLKQ